MSTSAPFVGTWRITQMSMWDQEAIDTCGPGHFLFARDNSGSLNFIAIESELDCRYGKTKAGKPLVRFSWSGQSEYDPISGRGWAIISGGKLRGRLFIHLGDESSFVAKREDLSPRPPPSRKRKWN